MKKALLFALILSVLGSFMLGCSGGGSEDTNAGVNSASTVKADSSQPPSPTNPGGATPQTPQ